MVAYLSAGWRDAARALTARVAAPTPSWTSGRPWTCASIGRVAAVALCGLATANCSAPQKLAGGPRTREVDPKYGVAPSPRLYGENDAIPKGGGRNFTGRPYVVAGKTYTPREDPRGYVREGLASWYGTAFHGRQTANGEVFDRFSVAAAHPTLPLPSYARVTNLANGHSMIVRVNDRGPYHENRVMDVSQRVAEALEFRRAGTTKVRIEYVGKASLAGSDDTKLMATLRTDGRGAPLPGQRSIMFADAGAEEAPAPRPTLVALAAARATEAPEESFRPVAPRPVEAPQAVEPAKPALAFRPAPPEPHRQVAAVLRTGSPMHSPAPVLRAAAPTTHPAARVAEARPPLRLTAPPLRLASALPAPPERPAGKGSATPGVMAKAIIAKPVVAKTAMVKPAMAKTAMAKGSTGAVSSARPPENRVAGGKPSPGAHAGATPAPRDKPALGAPQRAQAAKPAVRREKVAEAR